MGDGGGDVGGTGGWVRGAGWVRGQGDSALGSVRVRACEWRGREGDRGRGQERGTFVLSAILQFREDYITNLISIPSIPIDA